MEWDTRTGFAFCSLIVHSWASHVSHFGSSYIPTCAISVRNNNEQQRTVRFYFCLSVELITWAPSPPLANAYEWILETVYVKVRLISVWVLACAGTYNWSDHPLLIRFNSVRRSRRWFKIHTINVLVLILEAHIFCFRLNHFKYSIFVQGVNIEHF